MSKTVKIFLFSLLAVVVFIVIVDGMRVKPVDWTPTYSLDKKNPLDLYVFNREIENIFRDRKLERINTTFYEYWNNNNEDTLRNYLIISNNAYNDLDTIMLKAVEKGNNLLVCSESITKSFLDTLHVDYSYIDFNSDLLKKDTSVLTLCATHWAEKRYLHATAVNSFVYLKMNRAHTAILGEIEFPNRQKYPNFIRVKFGKGNIFLHNQPAVFTNFALLQPRSSADYAANVLACLPENLTTVWLVKGQTNKSVQDAERTPLEVILRYPAMRMTWYLFLAGLLLYIFFNAKRRQRIVPIIKPLPNTTVEFTQTIGNLYHQGNDAINVVQKKIVYFLDKVRNRYYLDTQILDEKFEEKLQLKSGKDKELIRNIMNFIRQFQKNRFAENADFVQLNGWIEKFWDEKV